MPFFSWDLIAKGPLLLPGLADQSLFYSYLGVVPYKAPASSPLGPCDSDSHSPQWSRVCLCFTHLPPPVSTQRICLRIFLETSDSPRIFKCWDAIQSHRNYHLKIDNSIFSIFMRLYNYLSPNIFITSCVGELQLSAWHDLASLG